MSEPIGIIPMHPGSLLGEENELLLIAISLMY